MKPSRKKIKVCLRMVAISLSYLLVTAAAGLGWVCAQLPDIVYLEKGQPLAFAQLPYVQMQPKTGARPAARNQPSSSENVTLSLGGVLRLKTVRAVQTDRPVVQVCGTPFGIKMFSDGALVVAFSDIDTPAGRANPAKSAGLQLGDWVTKAGDIPVHENRDLAKALQEAKGKPVPVDYLRDGKPGTVCLVPVQDDAGHWKAGVWVRDSSAGVGTLTFVETKRGVFAGLGHPISDHDTGQPVSLRTGEIVPCAIERFEKGRAGRPGELKGRFLPGLAVGTIRKNSSAGVFGTVRKAFSGEYMPVAFAQEIQPGPAQILTTINGTKPRRYQVEIERVNCRAAPGQHDLLLRVTDQTLLRETGGILQGMSGSPILQNGRLVGAVTHVLVQDSTRGYGIFIENMLKAAE